MAPPVTSGLLVHFDAGTIAQSDNTAVASWTPTAGAETAPATQATVGQRPIYRTSRINSLPAVVFTASNSQCMDTGAWTGSYSTPNTAFVVAKLTNGGTGSAANLFTGRSGVLNYIGQEDGFIKIGAGAGGQLTAAHTPDANFHIYAAVYNGASSAIYFDSATAVATGSTGTGTASDNMPGMRIGSTSTGGGNFPDGEIAEILFYDNALTGSQISATLAYYDVKYALGLGISTPVDLAGMAAAASRMTAPVIVDRPFAGNSGASSLHTGAIQAERDIASLASSASSQMSAPVLIARSFTGQAPASSGVSGPVAVLRPVVSNPASAATSTNPTIFTLSRGVAGSSFASSTVNTIELTTSNAPVGTLFGGYIANILDRGMEPVTVYLEEVTFDSDGNTQTRAKTTGIDTMATVQVAAASGTSSRRSEQDNEGFETEENWRIRFPRRFPYLLGAQSKVRWRGLMYSVVGDAKRYNGSRRTAHIDYTIRRT